MKEIFFFSPGTYKDRLQITNNYILHIIEKLTYNTIHSQKSWKNLWIKHTSSFITKPFKSLFLQKIKSHKTKVLFLIHARPFSPSYPPFLTSYSCTKAVALSNWTLWSPCRCPVRWAAGTAPGRWTHEWKTHGSPWARMPSPSDLPLEPKPLQPWTQWSLWQNRKCMVRVASHLFTF